MTCFQIRYPSWTCETNKCSHIVECRETQFSNYEKRFYGAFQTLFRIPLKRESKEITE